jgi:ribonuclease HI
MIVAFTDGGNSLRNQVGGAAAIITKNNMILAELVEVYEGPAVTNNTCELSGVLLAGQYLLEHPELGRELTIVSDSEYVVLGAKDRLDRWINRGWRTTTGPVKNQELWEAVALLKKELNIEWKWCKGHEKENILNNRADELLVKAYRKLIKK